MFLLVTMTIFIYLLMSAYTVEYKDGNIFIYISTNYIYCFILTLGEVFYVRYLHETLNLKSDNSGNVEVFMLIAYLKYKKLMEIPLEVTAWLWWICCFLRVILKYFQCVKVFLESIFYFLWFIVRQLLITHFITQFNERHIKNQSS